MLKMLAWESSVLLNLNPFSMLTENPTGSAGSYTSTFALRV